MPRRCLPRFASLLATLAVAVLTSCGPAMVPAPIANPQSPYFGRYAPPPPSGVPPTTAGGQKVALLLPLSGANAELGQAILDAAQLVLFEAGADRLTLLPRDTSGSAAGAASAARAVIGEGVHLILGPLLAPEVEAVKPIARDAHLSVIAFSTVTNLAGGNVFLMGFLPRQEVVREVGYARQRGLRRFAALAPNSPYGHLAADALQEAVSSSGGTVAKIEFFEPGPADPAPSIQRLLSRAPAIGVVPVAAGPAPSFDALLLPEGGTKLKQVARQVRAQGAEAKPVQLLGSGLWDTPDIGSEPALEGGWFAASPPDARQEFDQRFTATYGHRPPRLASLGYDAAALAAVLARAPSGEPFSPQAILNPSGFTGVDGLFRFTPNGLVQRGLAVLEVEPKGAVVISPALQSFQDVAF